MKKALYSNKVAIIFPSPPGITLPERFDVYTGTIDECTLNIKKTELINDALYSGVLIINDLSHLDSTLEYIRAEKNVEKVLTELVEDTELTLSNIFFTKIVHSGVDSECTVEDKLVYCSTWTLPFYSYIKRAGNTLYANCIRHRVQMVEFLKSIYDESRHPH
jgi:hypothetical protein